MSNLIHRYQHLGTATEKFKSSLEDKSSLVEDILTKVVIDSLRRYQQRLQVGVQDSVADLLATFKLKIAEEIWNASQDWVITTHREPVLFPPSCRYLYTLAGSTFVVIEQEPIVRTLRLDQSLLYASTSATHFIQQKRLAIPYTTFILHLRNTNPDGSGEEVFSNLYIGWRNSPLSTLKDEIYSPYLPNIHTNTYTVCTGHMDLKMAQTKGISTLTQTVISNFWNSNFNTDLTFHWNAKELVPQIATVEEWEKNSQEDPLFILSIPLLYPIRLDDLITKICIATEKDAPETIDLRHKVTEMTDALAEELFRGIKNYIFKTKFDRFYPKDVTDNLAEVMESMAKDLRTIALGVELQLQNISEEVNGLRANSYKWKKRSSWWTD